MRASKVRIGELLIADGLITKEQLKEVLEIQKKTGKRIGEIVTDMKMVSQDDFLRVLEKKFGIRYVDLKKIEVDPQIVKLVSETIARRYDLIPIGIENGKLIVAMSDPLNIYAIDDITYYTQMAVEPVISSLDQIRKIIGLHFGEGTAIAAAEEFKKQFGGTVTEQEEDVDIEALKTSSPIIKILNTVFEQAIRSNASDIHIEPQENSIRIRLRIDGQLEEVMRQDITLLSAIIVRIKILSQINIAEKRKPQDGRFSLTIDDNEYDMRVSCLPTIHGEKVVIRVIDKKGLVMSKKDIIRYKSDLEKFDSIIKNSYGMVLITGPTGSGKSTTMYTMIGELNRDDVNIVSIEDPVEASITGINQVQVNAKAGLDFTSALRSFLRQDPDIIVVGEIRDKETVEIAIRAAITGHLVISTIYTNDAPSTITRLLDMNIESFLIGSAIVGIIAQRLVRRICSECKTEYEPMPNELTIIQTIKLEGIQKLYRGKGCPACNNTGYRGRIGVYEILPISHAIKELINQNASCDAIRETAIEEGMLTLRASCARLVRDGVTTLDELIKIAYSLE
ncbi:MAG: Type II secretion system protein E [Firmicutes bacterium ADurb.Bin193]|nr:MAG: Type II secretion system protein E [Firmicutes bacterium ADurb.Bin193]